MVPYMASAALLRPAKQPQSCTRANMSPHAKIRASESLTYTSLGVLMRMAARHCTKNELVEELVDGQPHVPFELASRRWADEYSASTPEEVNTVE